MLIGYNTLINVINSAWSKKLLTFNAADFKSTPTRLDIAQTYVAVKANDHLKYLVGSLHRAQLRPWHKNGRIVICRINGVPPNEAGKD